MGTVKKPTQDSNLRKYITFLWNLKPRQFRFSQVVSKCDKSGTCGTVCCALGWLPAAFPGYFQWSGTNKATYVSARNSTTAALPLAARLLGISEKNLSQIFYGYGSGVYLDPTTGRHLKVSQIKAEHVIRELRAARRRKLKLRQKSNK